MSFFRPTRLRAAALLFSLLGSLPAVTITISGQLRDFDTGGDETRSFQLKIVYNDSFAPTTVPAGSPIGYFHSDPKLYPAALDYFLFPIEGVVSVAGWADGYGSFANGSARGAPIYPAAGEVLLFDRDIRSPYTWSGIVNGTFYGGGVGFDVGMLMGGYALYDLFLINDYNWLCDDYLIAVTKTPDSENVILLLAPIIALLGYRLRRPEFRHAGTRDRREPTNGGMATH